MRCYAVGMLPRQCNLHLLQRNDFLRGLSREGTSRLRDHPGITVIFRLAGIVLSNRSRASFAARLFIKED
jgi:hypothetical protein